MGSNKRKIGRFVLPFFLFLGQKSLKNRYFSRKKKAQKPAWLLDFLMAEAVGFEPTSP
jgi:hypothetical protein